MVTYEDLKKVKELADLLPGRVASCEVTSDAIRLVFFHEPFPSPGSVPGQKTQAGSNPAIPVDGPVNDADLVLSGVDLEPDPEVSPEMGQDPEQAPEQGQES